MQELGLFHKRRTTREFGHSGILFFIVRDVKKFGDAGQEVFQSKCVSLIVFGFQLMVKGAVFAAKSRVFGGNLRFCYVSGNILAHVALFKHQLDLFAATPVSG